MRCHLCIIYLFLPFFIFAQVPSRGDKVVVRLSSDPLSLNPVLNQNTVLDQQISNYMFQSLITRDPISLKNVPVLCKELPNIQNGDKEVTLEIREEAFWDNHTPITGHDVAFMAKVLKVMSKKNALLTFSVDDILDVVVDPINPKKFTIKVKIGNGFNLLSFPILPKYKYDPEKWLDNYELTAMNPKTIKKVWEEDPIKKFIESFDNERRASNPEGMSGSGPYKLKIWKKDNVMLLERKVNWWADALTTETSVLFKAYPEKIEYQIINDMRTTVEAIKLQSVDIVPDMAGKEFKDLQKLDSNYYKFRLRVVPTTRTAYLVLNNLPSDPKKFFLRDKKVRKALAHVVNVEEIIEKLLKGHGIPISCFSPIQKTVSYNTNLKPVEYDTLKAVKLLEEAGFKEINEEGIRYKTIEGEKIPLEIKFTLAKGEADNRKLLFFIANEAKKVGISILTQEVSTEEEDEAIKNHTYEGYLSFINHDIRGQASSPIAWKTDFSGNHNQYSNLEVDKLIDKLEKEKDAKKQKEIFDKINEYLYEDMPCLWLWQEESLLMYSSRFEDVNPTVVWGSYPGYYIPMFWTPKEKVKYK